MAETPGRLTLWGIEVFVAVAEEGSISAAAGRLGASPATVSQQLTNLETAVGTTLVDRSARPVRATPAGEMFLSRANTILDEADHARAELAMADLSRLTRFRLGMIEDFDADITPRLLASMASDLRDCRFLLETGASHTLTARLEDRALDVIVSADLGAAPEWMEVHGLLADPFLLAAPKGAIDPAADTLSQLADMPMVRYTSGHLLGRQIESHLKSHGLTPRSRFEMDSYHAILAMVAGRIGWSVLTPLGALRARRFLPQVDVLPLPLPPAGRRIMLYARAGVLGDMPARTAQRLRGHLSEMIVAPLTQDYPWLSDGLHLL